MTVPRTRLAFVATGLLALILTGCGGSSSASTSSAAAQPQSASGAAPDSGKSVAGGATRAAADVRSPAVISTGQVDLASRDVGGTRSRVLSVLGAAHGTIADATTGTDPRGRTVYAHLVLRVPSAGFDGVMDGLSGLSRLRHSSRQSEDVTTQVIDVAQRVRANRLGLRRLEGLLRRTANLGDLLRVEQETTTRQAALDSLVAQQRYLAGQTSQATITVDIDKIAAPPPPVRASGFGTGLSAGWRALNALGEALLTTLGAVVPFGVVLLLVAVPSWKILRLVRSKRVTPAAAGGGADQDSA